MYGYCTPTMCIHVCMYIQSVYLNCTLYISVSSVLYIHLCIQKTCDCIHTPRLAHMCMCMCTVLSCVLIGGRATQGKGAEQFLHSLEDLLHATCRVMKVECPENELVTPRAQAQALQFFPQTFDLFLSVMSVHTLASIVSQFLNNLKETKLKIYKSVFMSAVISSELFKHKGQSPFLIAPLSQSSLCVCRIPCNDIAIDITSPLSPYQQQRRQS